MAEGVSVGALYASLKLEKSQFDHSLRSSGSILGSFAKLAVATGAVLAGALTVTLRNAARSADEYYQASYRISKITGLNITQSSKLVAVFARYGIEGDKAVRTISFLEKTVGILTSKTKTATAFEKLWGFSLRDANGHVKNANALILQAADYFTNKHIPAAKRAALEAKLFGKSWGDLIPILALGSKGIKAAALAAAELGLVLTAQNAKDLAAYRQSQIKLHEAFAGLKLQLGLAIIPLFTRLANLVTERVVPAIRHAVDRVHAWIASHGDLLDGLRSVVGLLRDWVGYLQGSWLPSISSIVSRIGDWVAANKPLIDQLRVFSSKVIATGIKTIIEGFKKLGPAAPLIVGLASAFLILNAALHANPIVAAISAIVVAVGLLRIAWDTDFAGIQETFAQWAPVVEGIFNRVLDTVRTFVSGVPSALGGAISSIVTSTGAWLDANKPLIDQLVGFGTFLLDTFLDVVKRVSHAFSGDLVTSILDTGAQILNYLIPKVEDLITTFVGPGGVIESVAGVVGPILADLIPAFGKIVDALFGADGLVPQLGDFVAYIWGGGNGPLAFAVKAVGATVVALANFFAENLKPILLTLATVILPPLILKMGVFAAETLVALGPLLALAAAIFGVYKAIEAVSNSVTSGPTGGGVLDFFQDKMGTVSYPDVSGTTTTNSTLTAGDLQSIPGFATGTPRWRGGWAMLGERGPELARLPSGTQIYSAQQTAGLLGGGGLVIEHMELNGIGNDVSPGAARRFAQLLHDELATTLQEQSARFGSRPRVAVG